MIGLLAAYANAVAYGFIYGQENHEFELALVNWLRDPSLYPNDPIREAFARFPTVFWPVVARLSHWLSTENVVFLFFVLTKLLFFLALARLAGAMVKDYGLAACIVFGVALSPFLNDLTPLGASDVLNSVQTHTSLAIALLLWAGCLLLEGRWPAAAVLCALTIYLDALFFVYFLVAFAVFAVFDWQARRTRVALAALLGAAIALPWLLLSQGVVYPHYPSDYVKALVAFYPYHLKLSSHDPYELVCGAGVVVAAASMIAVARKAGLRREARFELLAGSFLAPVLLGAFFGQFHLTPLLARLQLLRADSFLLLWSILLIQIYGANLLLASKQRPATTLFFGATAVLLPLSDLLGLLWPLFIGMFFWAVAGEHLEALARVIARSRAVQSIGVVLLLVGITLAGLPHADWSSAVVIFLTVAAGCFFAYGSSGKAGTPPAKLTAAVCGAAFLMVAAGTVPKASNLWNPVFAPEPWQADWREVQLWAKAKTPQDAQFLVPTFPGGFREFSERSSWGEWKDGQAMYHFPPFALEYRRRMEAVGYPWPGPWRGTPAIREGYRRLSWERLVAIARENHLSHIVGFRDMPAPIAPVFLNRSYAVYRVTP